MSMKLKALGLALVAVLAVGVFGAANASGTTGGHFIVEDEHTLLEGGQVAEYSGTFGHGESIIECKTAEVEGSVLDADTTVTEVTLLPIIAGCRLQPLPSVSVPVTFNGCDFKATIGKKATTHNTLDLVCPQGKVVELHWSIFLVGSCTVTIKPQTTAGGVAYHTGGSGKTHDILADITTEKVHAVYHQTGFGCSGTSGTSELGKLNAEATVKGRNTAGQQVGVTATGSED